MKFNRKQIRFVIRQTDGMKANTQKTHALLSHTKTTESKTHTHTHTHCNYREYSQLCDGATNEKGMNFTNIVRNKRKNTQNGGKFYTNMNTDTHTKPCCCCLALLLIVTATSTAENHAHTCTQTRQRSLRPDDLLLLCL